LGQTKEQESLAAQAIQTSQNEVLAHPNSADAYYRLGRAYLEHRYSDAPKAADAFLQATRLKPDYAEAYFGLALAYDRDHRHQMQEAHPKKEIHALKMAIRFKPDYAEAFVQLARTHMPNDTLPNLDPEKTYRPAVELLKKAIASEPNLAEAYGELGWAYSVLRDRTDALAALKQAILLKPDDSGIYSLLDRYSARFGDVEGPIEIYEQAIKDDPNNALAQESLGTAYLATHKYEKAAEHFQHATRIQPDSGSLHYKLGCTYLLLGNKEAALIEQRTLEDLITSTDDDSMRGSYRSKAEELLRKIRQ
jgi:tetratricopeptide (TPR) repeat protein